MCQIDVLLIYFSALLHSQVSAYDSFRAIVLYCDAYVIDLTDWVVATVDSRMTSVMLCSFLDKCICLILWQKSLLWTAEVVIILNILKPHSRCQIVLWLLLIDFSRKVRAKTYCTYFINNNNNIRRCAVQELIFFSPCKNLFALLRTWVYNRLAVCYMSV